jgi:hypothetical protein
MERKYKTNHITHVVCVVSSGITREDQVQAMGLLM